MSNEIFNGPSVELTDMLAARERRMATQWELLEKAPDAALLSATMNVPGPVKNSPALATAFAEMMEAVKAVLADDLLNLLERSEKTGLEFYGLVDLTPQELKEKMITLEETHPYGRLVDLDVLWLADDELHSISRQTLGYPPRRCFLCDRDAKDCGRSRRHSIAEMQQKISELLKVGKE